jgi:hypothetical protein
VAALALLLIMGGCARYYDYDIQAHNSSSERIAMRVVRSASADDERGVFMTEISPGSSSSFSFQARVTRRMGKVEARFRRLTDEAWVRREVASGTPARLDVRVVNERVVVTDAGANDVGSIDTGVGGGARGSPDR